MPVEKNEATDNVMEVLLNHLGMGRWSFLHIVAACVTHAVTGIHTMSAAFVAPVVSHTCRLPIDVSLVHQPHAAHNISILPDTFHHIPGDKCAYIVNGSNGAKQQPCTEWDFDNSSFTSTITSEFSLVCWRAYLVPLYQSLYMVGCGIGSICGGILSDKYGRRPVMTVSYILYVVMAACISWLPNLPLIYFTRLFLGILHMVTLQSFYVLVMEMVPSGKRVVVGMLMVVPWPLFITVFSGLGYLLREWRDLQRASSLPFLIILPLFMFINESPHWLMVQGKKEKVLQVLTRAAALHKVVLPSANIDELKEKIDSKEHNKQKTEEGMSVSQKLTNKVLELLVLFRTPRLRLCTLVMCLNFFTASGVYFSLSLNAVNFSADPFIYMALSGLVEILSYVLMAILLAYVGRKRPAIGSFLFTGAAIFTLLFIPFDMWQIKMAVTMLGKMTISAVFVELFLYASEVFPTEVRIQGLGTGLFASRCGSIISPFFNDLLVPVYPLAMPIVVGGLSILASLSSCLLPETKGAKLPSLVEEVEGAAVAKD